MGKLFIGLGVVLLLLIVIFFLSRVSISYEETSSESTLEYKKVTDLISELECPHGGVTQSFIQKLKTKYPDMLFAMKGEYMLIDGFQFGCFADESGNIEFREVRD